MVKTLILINLRSMVVKSSFLPCTPVVASEASYRSLSPKVSSQFSSRIHGEGKENDALCGTHPIPLQAILKANSTKSFSFLCTLFRGDISGRYFRAVYFETFVVSSLRADRYRHIQKGARSHDAQLKSARSRPASLPVCLPPDKTARDIRKEAHLLMKTLKFKKHKSGGFKLDRMEKS